MRFSSSAATISIICTNLKLFICLLTLSAQANAPVLGASEIPPPPQNHISDEKKLLSDEATSKIEKILSEHAKAAKEQLLLLVTDGFEEQSLTKYANTVLLDWQKRRFGSRDLVLFALDRPSTKAAIAVSFSLENVLTQETISETIRSVESENNNMDQSALNGLVAVLKSLNSPVIAGFEDESRVNNPPDEVIKGRKAVEFVALSLVFIIAAITIALTLLFFTARETHFTAAGWFRIKPTQLLKSRFAKPSSAAEALSETWD